MKITLDPNAILPTRAHPYDAGLDLYMKLESEPMVIPPIVVRTALEARGDETWELEK